MPRLQTAWDIIVTNNKQQRLIFTLTCGTIHLVCMYLLFIQFISLTPDSDYLGLINAYAQKARGLYFQTHGLRPMILIIVTVSGALTLKGLLEIFECGNSTKLVLGWVSPALFAYLVILGLGYVVRPNYLDPGESHVTMLSLLLTEGKPIYSPEDNADLANTWYGPVLFLANAVFLFVIPDPMLATKLRGLVGLVVGMLVFYKLSKNQFGKTIAQAGLIHVIVTVFLAVYFSVGNRADSLILSLGLCAAGGTMIKSKQVAMLFTAFCIAGAVNSKVTAAAYMLPIAAYMVTSRGWKYTLQTTVLSIGLFLVPFLIYPLFPIQHYANYISMATSHKFETALLQENIGFGLYMILPLLSIAILGEKVAKKKAKQRVILYLTTTVTGIALICLTASKEGSGFYHLLGFSPGIGLLFMDLLGCYREKLSGISSTQVKQTGAILTYGWVSTSFLLTFGGQIQLAYGYKLMGQPNPRQEIQKILKDFPDKRIAMGYGDKDDYGDTRPFYRALLFKTTKDNPMNSVTLEEFRSAQKPFPAKALARIKEESYDLFLIPSGGVPFSAEIFNGTEIKKEFDERYEKLQKRDFFEVWARKSLIEANTPSNEITRSTLHLNKYLAQVQPKHPEKEQLQTQTEKKQGSKGEPARYNFSLTDEEHNADGGKISKYKKNQSCAKVKGKFQSEGGEGEDAVGGEPHGLSQGVTALACEPRGAVEGKLHLIEANVGHLTTEELEVLVHLIEGVHTLAVQKPEVCTSRHKTDLCHSIEDPVEPFGKSLLCHTRRTGIATDGIDDVSTVLPKLEHFRKERWGMLKITVQCNYDIALCSLEPTAQGVLMTHIPGKAKTLDGSMASSQLAHDLKCAVFATIIDQNDLITGAGHLAHNLFNFMDKFRDTLLLVEKGDHERHTCIINIPTHLAGRRNESV